MQLFKLRHQSGTSLKPLKCVIPPQESKVSEVRLAELFLISDSCGPSAPVPQQSGCPRSLCALVFLKSHFLPVISRYRYPSRLDVDGGLDVLDRRRR
jgi:hypothetical protein